MKYLKKNSSSLFARVACMLFILGASLAVSSISYAGVKEYNECVTFSSAADPAAECANLKIDPSTTTVAPSNGTDRAASALAAEEAALAAKQKKVEEDLAKAKGQPAAPASPNALQPAGLYAIPSGHDRVKAKPADCNLINNLGDTLGLNSLGQKMGVGNVLNKGVSGVDIRTPYMDISLGGCDNAVPPTLDGPGSQEGLELFKRDYKGNKYGSAMGILAGWTNFALPFVSIIAIIAIIYAGFLYLTAFGNDEQTGKAKKIILFVVAGIVIILSAYALVNTVISGSSG